jgi:hypothetical protein
MRLTTSIVGHRRPTPSLPQLNVPPLPKLTRKALAAGLCGLPAYGTMRVFTGGKQC